ncbi:MAG: S8 family serine peptidase [Prevotella sp.]
MMYQRFYSLLFFILVLGTKAAGQRPELSKLSPTLRRLAIEQWQGQQTGARKALADMGRVCAFVRIGENGEEVMEDCGCKVLARVGDICIADVPLRSVGTLSRSASVSRIEAGRGMSLTLDTMAFCINTGPVYAGTRLPQAFTGRGVMMGVMDVGFDLTHPTFADPSTGACRIRAFWDQLAVAEADGGLYVGSDFTTPEDIAAYAHSRDGLKQNHGTHTAGIAAGNGVDGAFRGVAFESDICLVSNAVSDDVEFIDEADLYKYTYATDALGFKYIFDYADRLGLPCVISFSEGSHQDFRGDDVLFYEMLSRLTGPGHILVASAGNEGRNKAYMHKPVGQESVGAFVQRNSRKASLTVKSSSRFTLRFSAYGDGREQVEVPVGKVLDMPDSTYTESVELCGHAYGLEFMAYPSCYGQDETVFDITVSSDQMIGVGQPFSVELVGAAADVELYAGSASLTQNACDPALNGGECSHTVYSPGSAPNVICVGATSYRSRFVNVNGSTVQTDWGDDGLVANYSSVGPTFDGRTKPETVAPGSNVVSAFSSYYLEAHPDATTYVCSTFPHGGRTYGWASFSGTSMSTPAVAGTIALWLQAKPDLTPEEAVEVLAQTCTRIEPELDYPDNRYGFGEVDAYAGLLHILGLSGIDGLSLHQPRQAEVWLKGSDIHIRPGVEPARAFRVMLYAMDGRQVVCADFPEGTADAVVSASRLPHGVYAVQVQSADSRISGSSLVRY